MDRVEPLEKGSKSILFRYINPFIYVGVFFIAAIFVFSDYSPFNLHNAQAAVTSYVKPTAVTNNGCTAPSGGNWNDEVPPTTLATHLWQCNSDNSPNLEDQITGTTFSLGLPGIVSSIDGIVVHLNDVSVASSVASTQDFKVRLSWDGGTTWTSAAQNDATSCATPDITSTALDGAEYYCSGTSSTAVTSDPSSGTTWGHSWTLAELNSTNFKVQVTADNASNTAAIQRLDIIEVKVYYTPLVFTISGTCVAENESTSCPNSESVRFAINGTLANTGADTTATTSSGAFTITPATTPVSGDVITVFINGVADDLEAVAVTKWDGSGVITGINLIEGSVSIGSDDNQSLTNTNMGSYDGSVSADEDIFFDVMSSATCDGQGSFTGLCADYGNAGTGQFSNTEQIYIKASNTYAPAGNVRTAKMDVAGTYTGASETITLTGAGTTNTTCTATTDMPLCKRSAGTFTPTSNIVTYISTSATNIAALTYSTLEFKPTSGSPTYTLGDASSQTFTAATFTVGNGTNAVTVTGATNNPAITVSGVLTVAASGVFTTGSGTITLSGTGTPLVTTGTFTASTSSTVSYTNITSVNVARTTYNNLSFLPASGTPTYTLLGGGTLTANNFTLGGAGNVTVDANTNDPAIDINGDFVIGASDVYTPSGTAALNVGGSLTITGSITASTNGDITFDATTTGKTLSGITCSTFDVITFNGSGGEWTGVNLCANTLTVTAGNLILSSTLYISTSMSGAGTVNSTSASTCQACTINNSGNWILAGLSLGDGSLATINLSGAGTITSNTLTVSANATVNAGSKTIIVTGTGTPFTRTGTWNADTSTIQYTGATANITGTTYYNLTLGGTGTYTLPNSAWGVNHDLIITNGVTVTKGTGTLTFGGTTASIFTDNTTTPQNIGAVSINKTDTGAPSTNNKLTLASSMTLDTLTIDGTSGQADTINLGTSGYTLTIANNGCAATVLTNNGTFTAGTSTVKFSALNTCSAVDIPAVPFNSLQFSGSETYVMIGSLAGANALTGNMTIDSGAILEGAGTIEIVGNWSNAGTYVPSIGTVDFIKPSGTQTVNHGSSTFYRVYHHGAGTLQVITNNLSLEDNLYNFAGTIDANNLNITIGGHYINESIFTAGTGTVIMNSAEAKSLSGNMTGSSKFYNLTFNNNLGSWTFGDFGANATEVQNDFTVTAGAVTAPASTLTIGRNFTNTPGTTSSFAHNGGTVVLDDASATSIITGKTTFNNFSCTNAGGCGAKTIKFQIETGGNPFFTFAGTMTLTGTVGSRITLRSDTDGSDWLAHFNSAQGSGNFSYVDLYDSGCHAGTANADMGGTGNVNQTGNGNTCWVFVATITISGSANGNNGATVKVAIDSTLQGQTTTITGGGTSWSITGITAPSAGAIITIWIDNVADSLEATTVIEYDGSGDVEDLPLNVNTFFIGQFGVSTDVSVSDLGLYDCDNDEDVMHSSNSSSLLTQGCSNSYTNEYLYITGGSALTVGSSESLTTDNLWAIGALTSSGSGTFNISGSLRIDGTYTPSSETFNFTSTGSETINGSGGAFVANNLTFNGSGGEWSVDIYTAASGDLTITAGTLTGTNSVVVGGSVTGAGVINMTGGTFTLSGTAEDFGGSAAWTFYDLTFGTGSETAFALVNAGGLTVTHVLTIDDGTVLDAGNKTVTLSGISVPFVKVGTLTANSSTFIYTGNGSTNIAAANYYNLQSSPAGAVTHFLGTAISQTLAVAGDFVVGNSSNNVTIDWDGYDPALSIGGDLTLNSPSTWTKSSSATLTFNGGSISTITDNNSTKQDLGAVQISVNGTNTELRMGSALKMTRLIIDASQTFNVNGSYDLELTGTSGTLIAFNASSVFTASTGTVTFTSGSGATIASAAMTGSNAFYNLIINGTGTFNAGAALSAKKDLVVSGGTLAMGANDLIVGDSANSSSGNIKVASGQSLTQTSSNTTTVKISSGSNCIGGNAASCAATAGTITLGSLTIGDGSTTMTTTLGDGSTTPTVTVAGVLTITASATLNGGTGTVTLSGTTGTPFVKTGTFTPASSTVQYTGNNTGGNTNIVATTYNNLTVNNGSETFDLAGTVTTNGNLVITAGILDTVSGQNRALNIGGNWTNTGTFTARLGTVTFNASSTGKTITSNGASGKFYDVTFNHASGGWTLQDATEVTHVLTITAGNLSAGSQTLTLSGSGTPFVNNGTFTHGTSTVNYTGTSATNVAALNGSGSTNAYYHLSVGDVIDSNSVTYTMLGNTTVKNVLKISNTGATGTDTLAASSFTLTLAGSTTPLNIISGKGDFDAGTSTVAYTSGSGVTALSNVSMTYNNLVINGTGTFNLTQSSSAQGDLSVTAGTLASSSANFDTLGDVTGNGIINFTGTSGFSVFAPTGNFGGDTAWAFNNLNIGEDATNNITATGTGGTTISGLMSFSTDTFNAGSKNWILSGDADLPLTIFNLTTFDGGTSTFTYTGNYSSGNTQIMGLPYNNLTFNNGSETYDMSGVTDITGNLTITAGTLDAVSGQNYPLSVGGNWSNSGTFTARNGSVNFTSDSGTKTLSGTLNGSSAFYNLTFSGDGTFQPQSAMLVNNDLHVNAGTLSGSNNITVNGGDVTGDGVINLTGGTFLVDGNGNFGGDTTDWNFYDLTFGDGTGVAATSNPGDGTATNVSHVMTIAANQTYAPNNTNILLSGSGTPLVIAGTLGASTGNVTYEGTGATNISPATYGTLDLNPASGSPTYTLGTSASQSIISSSFSAANVTVNADTYDPSLTFGSFVLSTNAPWTKSGSATLTLAPNGGAFSDTNATKQDLGNVSISGGVAATQGLGSSIKATSLTIGVGKELSLGSHTLTLTGNGSSVLVNNGTFTPGTGTVEFASAATTGTTVPALAYYNLKVNKSGNTFIMPADSFLSVGGNLDVTAGTLDLLTNYVDINISGNLTIDGTMLGNGGEFILEGNFINNGTFTHGDSTLTLEPTAGSVTIGGTSNTTFYQLDIRAGGKTILFQDGRTVTIVNNFVAQGNSTKLMALASTTLGQQWFIQVDGTATLTYLKVSDAGCSGDTNLSPGIKVFNAGNNGACWHFINRGVIGNGPAGGGAGGSGGTSGGGAGGSGGSTATATATVTNNVVTSYNVTSGGSGYTSVPTVTVCGVGGVGSGATGTAVLSGGVVQSITLGSGGSGYTGGATVTIATPASPSGSGGCGGTSGGGSGGGGGGSP